MRRARDSVALGHEGEHVAGDARASVVRVAQPALPVFAATAQLRHSRRSGGRTPRSAAVVRLAVTRQDAGELASPGPGIARGVGRSVTCAPAEGCSVIADDTKARSACRELPRRGAAPSARACSTKTAVFSQRARLRQSKCWNASRYALPHLADAGWPGQLSRPGPRATRERGGDTLPAACPPRA